MEPWDARNRSVDLLYSEFVSCSGRAVPDGLLILSGSQIRPDAHIAKWFKDSCARKRMNLCLWPTSGLFHSNVPVAA